MLSSWITKNTPVRSTPQARYPRSAAATANRYGVVGMSSALRPRTEDTGGPIAARDRVILRVVEPIAEMMARFEKADYAAARALLIAAERWLVESYVAAGDDETKAGVVESVLFFLPALS